MGSDNNDPDWVAQYLAKLDDDHPRVEDDAVASALDFPTQQSPRLALSLSSPSALVEPQAPIATESMTGCITHGLNDVPEAAVMWSIDDAASAIRPMDLQLVPASPFESDSLPIQPTDFNLSQQDEMLASTSSTAALGMSNLPDAWLISEPPLEPSKVWRHLPMNYSQIPPNIETMFLSPDGMDPFNASTMILPPSSSFETFIQPGLSFGSTVVKSDSSSRTPEQLHHAGRVAVLRPILSKPLLAQHHAAASPSLSEASQTSTHIDKGKRRETPSTTMAYGPTVKKKQKLAGSKHAIPGCHQFPLAANPGKAAQAGKKNARTCLRCYIAKKPVRGLKCLVVLANLVKLIFTW
jgi:hypothetical protein